MTTEPSLENLSLEDCLKRGHTALERRDWDRALHYLAPVTQMNPQYPEGWNKLAAAQVGKGHWTEAEDAARRCLALEPSHADAMVNLAVAAHYQKRDAESVNLCNRALTLAPSMPNAYWTRAFSRLRLGDWPGAWSDYQWGVWAGIRPARFRQPEWDGFSSIEGATLYCWMEQGVGDALMMLQLLKPLREQFRPGKVIVEVRPELVDLLWGFPYADEIVAAPPNRHQPRHFYAHVSLMSLPAVLLLTQGDLPAAVNYLGQGIDAAPEEGKTTIGVCWYGSDYADAKSTRNIPASVVDSIRWHEDVEVISLHAEGPLKNEALTEWKQTAEAIKRCHLIVTVDTGVAHLAGAMGVPVALLTHVQPEWRWHPAARWYPSLDVWRQLRPGDWATVLRCVIGHLAEIAQVPSL